MKSLQPHKKYNKYKKGRNNLNLASYTPRKNGNIYRVQKVEEKKDFVRLIRNPN